jgi:dihydrofolate reductase
MSPQCSAFIAVSLDGFIARRDGSIDWLSIVDRAGEDYGYRAFLDSIDTIIVGRKTYDTALNFAQWPYTGKRCVVLTHAAPIPQHGEEFHSGPPEPLVERLVSESAGRVYVDGGQVIRQFLAAGLITDMTISIVPIILGEGVRLFDGFGREVRLDLVDSRSFESGLVQVRYGVPD